MYCLLCHEKIPRLRAWRTKSEFCSDEHAALYKKQTLERLLTDANAPPANTPADRPAPAGPPPLSADAAFDDSPPEAADFPMAATAAAPNRAIPSAPTASIESPPPAAEGSEDGGGFDEMWGLAEEIGSRGKPATHVAEDAPAPRIQPSGDVRRQTAEEALEALRRLAERASRRSAEFDEPEEVPSEPLPELPPLDAEFFDEERLLSELDSAGTGAGSDASFGDALFERLAAEEAALAERAGAPSSAAAGDPPVFDEDELLLEPPEPDWNLLFGAADLHALESSLAAGGAVASPSGAAPDLEDFAEIEPPPPDLFDQETAAAAPAAASGKVMPFPSAREAPAPADEIAEAADSLEWATRDLEEAPLAALPAAFVPPPNGAEPRPAAQAVARQPAPYRPVEEFVAIEAGVTAGPSGTPVPAAQPGEPSLGRLAGCLRLPSATALRPARARLTAAPAAEPRFDFEAPEGAVGLLAASFDEPLPPRTSIRLIAEEAAGGEAGPLADVAPSPRGERIEPSLAVPRDERPASYAAPAQPIYANGELYVEPAARGR